MIKVLLWDVDGTLLDFHAAERAAVKALFGELGLGICTDEMITVYSGINKKYWERLERGEMTKEEILVARFREFFSMYGIDPEAACKFNEIYQVRLGDTIVYMDDSLEIVRSLREKVKQYAVSNGTIIAQTKKLDASGLGKLMDGIFLSEELGAEKPDRRFFDKVFEAIGDVKKREIMIVGDSLTSDMLGGINAGIVTCWYNPEGKEDTGNMNLNYNISDLHEITEVLKTEEEK